MDNQLGKDRLLYLSLRRSVYYHQKTLVEKKITIRQLKRKVEHMDLTFPVKQGILYEDANLKYKIEEKKVNLEFQPNLYREHQDKVGCDLNKEYFDQKLNNDETILDTVSIPYSVLEGKAPLVKKRKSLFKK